MRVDRNPLIASYDYRGHNWMAPFSGAKKRCFQKYRIREGPWRFREGFREGKHPLYENSGNVKVREGSVKLIVKGILSLCKSMAFLGPDPNSREIISNIWLCLRGHWIISPIPTLPAVLIL